VVHLPASQNSKRSRTNPANGGNINHRRFQNHRPRCSKGRSITDAGDGTVESPAAAILGLIYTPSPAVHPFWRIKISIEQNHQRFPSPLRRMAKAFGSVDINNLERIELFCLPPWQPRAKVKIHERERAEELTNRANFIRALFTDASSRRGRVGIGVTYLSPIVKLITVAQESSSF
jgi:hypothetical protein